MRFLQTLAGGLISVRSISHIRPYEPDKGARWYVVEYHNGRDYAFVHPDTMQAFFDSEDYQE